MTRIKFCGLTRPEDVEAANLLCVDYVGFVFAPGSTRYLTPQKAAELKRNLAPGILAVGVFVNEDILVAAKLLKQGLIDLAQLHGAEEEGYIQMLQQMTGKPVIKAFRIKRKEDLERALKSSADYILLDSGDGGSGECFDWSLIGQIKRPYFLAGGLNAQNIRRALETVHPYAVDVSSGIEINGAKNLKKMESFAAKIRKIDKERIEKDGR